MTKPQNVLLRCLSTKLNRKPTKSTPLNSQTNRTGGPEWKHRDGGPAQTTFAYAQKTT